MFEHLALGAGSYAVLGAVSGPRHRWQVGITGTVGIGLGKELTDFFNGNDTFPMALFHFVTILGGAGAVAAFWH